MIRPKSKITVLPFANISGNPKQEFFSDRISKELLRVLEGSVRMAGDRVRIGAENWCRFLTDSAAMTIRRIRFPVEIEKAIFRVGSADQYDCPIGGQCREGV